MASLACSMSGRYCWKPEQRRGLPVPVELGLRRSPFAWDEFALSSSVTSDRIGGMRDLMEMDPAPVRDTGGGGEETAGAHPRNARTPRARTPNRRARAPRSPRPPLHPRARALPPTPPARARSRTFPRAFSPVQLACTARVTLAPCVIVSRGAELPAPSAVSPSAPNLMMVVERS